MHIIILSSSCDTCDFYRHILMISSYCELGMLSSCYHVSSTFTSSLYHHAARLARTPFNTAGTHTLYLTRKTNNDSITLWVRQTHLIMISSTCDFDRHIGMRPSSCDFDRHIGMLPSSCYSCDFDRDICMLSSSCEFDRHILISSSCELDRHILISSSCEFMLPNLAPKRRFWKSEQTVRKGAFQHFLSQI